MKNTKNDGFVFSTKQPVHVTAPSSFILLGVRMDIHLSGVQTGGEFSLIEAFMSPGGDGGRHIHSNEDETIHVVSGQLEVTVGSEKFTLKAGETSFAPRNIPHRIQNKGKVEARAFLINTPGSFDRFVSSVGIPFEATTTLELKPPTTKQVEELLALAKKFGVIVVSLPGQ